MDRLLIFLLSTSIYIMTADAASCEAGWSPYKDKICIKLFTSVLSFEDANNFCSSNGTRSSNSSLVVVKDSEMQQLLMNITHGHYDNLWIGGKYDNQSGKFIWLDGEPLTYANWQAFYPSNDKDSAPCIEFRPTISKSPKEAGGPWANVPCRKLNHVICQRVSSWTLDDAIEEIIRIRKLHQDYQDAVSLELIKAKTEISKLQANLQTVTAELHKISVEVVPVGSIYVEYYNQPSPRSLWPNLDWDDISSTYAGQFFRAFGGGSASWGTIQSECAPRITQANFYVRLGIIPYPYQVDIPASGWSPQFSVGDNSAPAKVLQKWTESLKLYTQGCEVRPKNQAIRLWKRVG